VCVGAHPRLVIPACPVGGSVALMAGEHVSVDNFVLAETARMFAAIQGTPAREPLQAQPDADTVGPPARNSDEPGHPLQRPPWWTSPPGRH
jgi:hypothetical protein